MILYCCSLPFSLVSHPKTWVIQVRDLKWWNHFFAAYVGLPSSLSSLSALLSMALRESPRKSKIPLAEMKMVSHSRNKCDIRHQNWSSDRRTQRGTSICIWEDWCFWFANLWSLRTFECLRLHSIWRSLNLLLLLALSMDMLILCCLLNLIDCLIWVSLFILFPTRFRPYQVKVYRSWREMKVMRWKGRLT